MGFKGGRILFSPCGMGLGHVSRCTLIAGEVKRLGGEVLFTTYLEGVNYVSQHGFPVVKAPSIHLETDKTGSIDLRATFAVRGLTVFETLMNQIKFEMQQIMAFKPDLVFSDTRISTIIASRLLRTPCVLLLNQFLPRAPREKDTNLWKMLDGTVMTVLGRTWALADKVIIPDFPAPYTISVDSLRAPKRYGAKMTLVGSILRSKPEDSKGVSTVRRSLGVDMDKTLIYAGISGPKAERMPLIRLLAPIFKEFPDKYHVVMSTGDPHGGSEPTRIGNLTIIPWIVDRYSFLNACDLVINRGGHETIMQSIGYSKPGIIIPVPKHPEQYGNARRAKEIGVAESIHQRDVSKSTLLRMIDHLLSNDSRGTLAAINQMGLDAGLDRTLEIIAEYL